jgi:hypothetical protein
LYKENIKDRGKGKGGRGSVNRNVPKVGEEVVRLFRNLRDD